MAKQAKKKKLPGKKVSTKSVAQRKPKSKPSAPQTMAMVTVPIEQIQKVETYRGKMSVIPTPLTEMQIKHLVAPTPGNVVLSRPGKGGKDFDYIPGWYFKKKLNFVFGWMHDFEILGERIDGDFVTVKGKLTIKDKTGKPLISKTDFGGHPIQYLRGGKGYVDISNDFKAAATDCLKRCAVQLGIGLDIYSKGDYTNPNQPEAPVDGPVVAQQAQPVSGKPITVEAKEVKTSGPVDYLAKLNGRLEQLGYKSESRKKEYVLMKGGIPVKDWSKLRQSDAQMIIAVLAKNNAQRK